MQKAHLPWIALVGFIGLLTLSVLFLNIVETPSAIDQAGNKQFEIGHISHAVIFLFIAAIFVIWSRFND
jgi:polyferredoxin